MSQMKELYEKVAKDAALQKKLGEILSEGKKASTETTEEKLLAFVKDAGFSVSIGEMQEFFKQLEKKAEGELSDLELDMVAGGVDTMILLASLLTLGIGCAVVSLAEEFGLDDRNCADVLGR